MTNENCSSCSSCNYCNNLKMTEYKQAWIESWENTTQEDRDKVKELPNFDSDIFYEISGIRVDEPDKQKAEELTLEQVCKELGRDVKIVK